MVAFLGLALAPALTLLWVLWGAAACGSLIVMALSLFSLRTGSHIQAAELSGMAQSVGYAFAGTGPLAVGALYDSTGASELPLLLAGGCMI